MVVQIDSSITSLDELVEFFKSQNPSRKSAPRISPKPAAEIAKGGSADAGTKDAAAAALKSEIGLAFGVSTEAPDDK